MCLLQISNLIATEILRSDDVIIRVAIIEKWVAVADICRCLHNYNAVLEITSSLNRSSVFRLKKTWLKVSKQVGKVNFLSNYYQKRNQVGTNSHVVSG